MKNFVVVICFISSFLVLFSCKKKENSLGKNELPSGLLLSDAIDTFSLETSTYVEDSLLSSNLSNALLGSYIDPVFGKFEAEFFTQFNLSSLNPDFGVLADIKIDSFVLGVEYNGYYGNLNPQTFEVHQILDDLYLDTIYYSFQSKTTSGTDLMMPGKATITPAPSTPTMIGTQSVDPQIRLHLDTALARNFMLESANNPTTFSSNTDFLAYFKGLNIKVNNPSQKSGEGGILYFNLNDPLSKLTIYYREGTLNKSYDFLINSNCADFNHITITNSTKVQNVIDNPVLGQSQFYAQANKSRALVKLPTVSKIPKNAVIQYASLELPVSSYSYEPYFPSSLITVSTKISLTDDALYSLNVFGEYSPYSKSYKIDLRDYIQQIVNGKVENLGVYLSSSKMLSSSERINFNGINTLNKKKPVLRVIYTNY